MSTNLYHTFRLSLIEALSSLFHNLNPRDVERITAEPPKDMAHGDLATNAAMILAKPLGENPRSLAEKIAEALRDFPTVSSVQVAGPGFINVTFTQAFWKSVFETILHVGPSYGACVMGENTPVNVEYVSTNPTGPMHIGHARGAIVGDVLATLLEKVGYDVTREYYINDAGVQVRALAESLYGRYQEALGRSNESPGAYGGDYLKETAKDLVKEKGDGYLDQPRDKWMPFFAGYAVEKMMTLIKKDLAQLGVYHGVFRSEKELVDGGLVDAALEKLEALGHIYTGVLPPPKGHAVDEDAEPIPQTLFRSSAFGDDSDRVMKKADGSWTYFANDVAYHYDKFQRGFRHMINIWGADHGGYVKRVSAAVQAMTQGQGAVEVHLCQIVRFFDQGEILKMSKRQGTFLTVRDALEKVGKDALRFLMLWRKNDAPMDFDFQKAVEATKDNPVFYVQYAHARISSVLRHAKDLFPQLEEKELRAADLSDPNDLDLLKKLASWPRLLETAALVREPHRIAYFLYDVAGSFHALWTMGKSATHLRFIHEDDWAKTQERLALLLATRHVLRSGLDLMGVSAPEEMA